MSARNEIWRPGSDLGHACKAVYTKRHRLSRANIFTCEGQLDDSCKIDRRTILAEKDSLCWMKLKFLGKIQSRSFLSFLKEGNWVRHVSGPCDPLTIQWNRRIALEPDDSRLVSATHCNWKHVVSGTFGTGPRWGTRYGNCRYNPYSKLEVRYRWHVDLDQLNHPVTLFRNGATLLRHTGC